eukprot:TRINITY_DN18403_c0_g3_i1.p1 TRINITY_DN18403_c0_g3~~TRINITY_DN18403_c0_g3_i1.p1  ORF type:complete len:300 (+),score=78.36 TRINITY_DN18403_c0_g3_i1:63-902(+)
MAAAGVAVEAPPAARPSGTAVRDAVSFLVNPRVRQAPLTQRVTFLRSKGVSFEDVTAALGQVGEAVTPDQLRAAWRGGYSAAAAPPRPTAAAAAAGAAAAAAALGAAVAAVPAATAAPVPAVSADTAAASEQAADADANRAAGAAATAGPASEWRPWSLEQLAAHTGGAGQRLLLGCKGLVYEVNPDFYGPGKAYSKFAGKDCSHHLAVVKVGDEHANKCWRGLPEKDAKVLDDWEEKYQQKYDCVGWVVADWAYPPEGPPFERPARKPQSKEGGCAQQ